MKRRTGMVLGKFMPPHLGHRYLCEFAQRYVDDLVIVVGTLAREPIAGDLRFRWMRELFPNATVVHLTDENPQDPSEHTDFWPIWRASLERVLPFTPDFVFASETYGRRLAAELGAVFVPVDHARAVVPISGTEVRRDPFAAWKYLPRCVRAHFAKRVCVFGPESTGKTTLASRLADHYATTWVPEYARSFLEERGGAVKQADLTMIARGQLASEDALARDANRLLITDTDALATKVWSHALFGTCDPELDELASRSRADLYLSTDVDVPWVADAVRYLPNERASFAKRCDEALAGRNVVRVSGDRDTRFAIAVRAIDEMMAIDAEKAAK